MHHGNLYTLGLGVAILDPFTAQDFSPAPRLHG
jgi:hypothetical protein